MSFNHKPFKLYALARIITYKLYVQHVNDDLRTKLSVDEIRNLFSVPVSRNQISSALEMFRSYQNKYVARHKTGDTYHFSLTTEGILLIEEALQDKNSDIAYFDARGDEALEDVAGINGIYKTPSERLAEDVWEPLEIDRSDPKYLAAIESIDDALEKIIADNGYAAHRPAERETIIATLKEGLDWLKNRTPTKAQVMSKLVDPLRYVATSFSRAIIGEAAKQAAVMIMRWLTGLG